MASVPASHLILFVASMIVAAGIAGTVILEVNQLSDAVEMRGSSVTEEIETDIQIMSDSAQPNSIYNATGSKVTVLVKNIGSTSLEAHPSEFDLLLDGRYVTRDALAVERVDVNDDTWRPGGVVEVTVDLAQANLDVSGDTRIAVIVNDNEDSLAFYVDGTN